MFAAALRVLARGADGAGRRTSAGRRVRGLGRRHPGATGPGPLPRQPVVGPAGLRAGPGGRRPRRGGHPGRGQRRPARPGRGRRWSASARPGRCATPCTAAAADADAVVMAAAVADFRPATSSDAQDQEDRRRLRRPDRSWPRTPTSWPSSSRDRPRPGQVGGRLRRRDRRRAALDTAGPSSRPRAATCWWSTRSATAWRSAPTTTRRVILAADGAETAVPLGPKDSCWPTLIWDLVAGRLGLADPVRLARLHCRLPETSSLTNRTLVNRRATTRRGASGSSPVHLRVRHRRSPRQDRRPDQRRHPGRDARGGPDAAGWPSRR